MARPLKCPKCSSTDIEVYQLKCNYGAFNGYHYTPSDYSGVRCRACAWPWRTKSDQAYQLARVSAARGRPRTRAERPRPMTMDDIR
jgi:hypothetical protein